MTIVAAMSSPPDNEAVRRMSGVHPTSTVTGLNVLVVSGDDATRRGLQDALPRQQVARAGSVREALTALRSFAFDVVLCDATLRDGTAEDVFRELGDAKRLVILRGSKESRAALDFLARSKSVVLPKPCEITSLRLAIQVIAGRVRAKHG